VVRREVGLFIANKRHAETISADLEPLAIIASFSTHFSPQFCGQPSWLLRPLRDVRYKFSNSTQLNCANERPVWKGWSTTALHNTFVYMTQTKDLVFWSEPHWFMDSVPNVAIACRYVNNFCFFFVLFSESLVWYGLYHRVNSSLHSVNGNIAIQWEWSTFDNS